MSTLAIVLLIFTIVVVILAVVNIWNKGTFWKGKDSTTLVKHYPPPTSPAPNGPYEDCSKCKPELCHYVAAVGAYYCCPEGYVATARETTPGAGDSTVVHVVVCERVGK